MTFPFAIQRPAPNRRGRAANIFREGVSAAEWLITHRQTRQLASLFAWGWSFSQTITLFSEEADSNNTLPAVTNVCVALGYLLIHPGTVGDPEVPASQQLPLWRGLIRAVEVDPWSRIRLFTNSFVTLFWTAASGNRTYFLAPFTRAASNMCGMLPYAATVGGQYSRVFRVNPHVPDRADRECLFIFAGLLNFITYFMMVSSVTCMTVNMNYVLRSLQGAPSRDDPALASLYPQLLGIVANQLGLTVLNYLDHADSPAKRILFAGLPRLVARISFRLSFEPWRSRTDLVFYLVMELTDVMSSHHWFHYDARQFRDGLAMNPAHARAQFGNQSNVPITPSHVRFFRRVLGQRLEGYLEDLFYGRPAPAVKVHLSGGNGPNSVSFSFPPGGPSTPSMLALRSPIADRKMRVNEAPEINLLEPVASPSSTPQRFIRVPGSFTPAPPPSHTLGTGRRPHAPLPTILSTSPPSPTPFRSSLPRPDFGTFDGGGD